MKKTSLKQKLLLIIFGVILAVVLLEAALRMAGAVVLYLQERHNHLSFKQEEYRILCLGESTTALGGEDSYPSLLEEMLNAQNRQKKFTVINEGIISTTSDYILKHIDQNLDMYKPQMVVVMMGINDKAYLHNPYKALWWEYIKLYLEDFRVYKLAHLLYEHITHRIKEINRPAGAVDLSNGDDGNDQPKENFLKVVITNFMEQFQSICPFQPNTDRIGNLPKLSKRPNWPDNPSLKPVASCIELAKRYRLQGSFQEAQNILKQAAILNPNDTDIYQEWGELYLAQGKNAQAVKAFQAALALDPKNSDVLPGLARAFYQEHNDDAFPVYARYLQTKPQDYWGFIELAQWLRENKHYDLAQELFGPCDRNRT